MRGSTITITNGCRCHVDGGVCGAWTAARLRRRYGDEAPAARLCATLADSTPSYITSVSTNQGKF